MTWLRKYVWPISALIIIALELWAVFEGEGNTISDWVTDFPILLWIPVTAFTLWLPYHFIKMRLERKRLEDARLEALALAGGLDCGDSGCGWCGDEDA